MWINMEDGAVFQARMAIATLGRKDDAIRDLMRPAVPLLVGLGTRWFDETLLKELLHKKYGDRALSWVLMECRYNMQCQRLDVVVSGPKLQPTADGCELPIIENEGAHHEVPKVR